MHSKIPSCVFGVVLSGYTYTVRQVAGKVRQIFIYLALASVQGAMRMRKGIACAVTIAVAWLYVLSVLMHRLTCEHRRCDQLCSLAYTPGSDMIIVGYGVVQARVFCTCFVNARSGGKKLVGPTDVEARGFGAISMRASRTISWTRAT
jgi:hypothetical protein